MKHRSEKTQNRVQKTAHWLLIRLTWSDFLKPFNFEAPPGFDGRPIGCQTTFFPANVASLSLDGRDAEGDPWRMDRGGRHCTTACLAWCETWFRP